MRKLVYLLLPVLCIGVHLQSQVVDQPIRLRSFSVNIETRLFTATANINIELFNPNNKILDGEYSFSLSAGQVITGFALDINGKMRDGVIVDKQQGRVAYENTIRRRVDPGLLEMTAGDNYRIRVYPMPANGSRKIKIIINQELEIRNDSLIYSLPLDVKETVSDFDLSITSAYAEEMPFTNEGLIKSLSFTGESNPYTLKHEAKNIELKKPVSFSIPIKRNSICFFYSGSEKYYAAHLKPTLTPATEVSFSSATVFGDVSGSGKKRDISKEISFLEKFCQKKNISQLLIVTFSNEVHDVRRFNVNRDLNDGCKNFLMTSVFDGGTQLGVVDCNKYSSGVYLLFSDGKSNYGNADLKTNSKPVYCISSSASADKGSLKKLSDKTNGRYIDLTIGNVDDAIKNSSAAKNKLLSLHPGKGNISVNSIFPARFTEWLTISGKASAITENFILDFGDMGKVSTSENISFTSTVNCDSADIVKLILMQQYAAMQKENRFQNTRVAFAKANKIVSNSTSFIVLDNLQDYIQYGIEPPADLMDEYQKRMGDITQRKEEQRKQMEYAEINNLRTSVSQYNERVSWWNKNEPLIVFDDVLKKNNEINAMVIRQSEERKAGNNKSNNSPGETIFDLKSSGNSLSEVVVVGYGTQRRRYMTGSVSVINSSQLSSSMTVAQALEGRVAGVQVIENGYVGSTPQVIIRGAATSFSNGQPLYIVDGIAMDADYVLSITANEIESITVLKDAQAGMIYGSRASNGVIVITRKTRNTNNNSKNTTRYKDLEDVDYVTDLKEADKEEMYQRYLNMKDSLGEEPSFYFDAAEIMYETGDKQKALRIITNLLEIDNENHQLLRAVGYVFEKWGLYNEAVEIYKKVLEIKEEEPQSYRDLALAYDKASKSQDAVEILYSCLSKDWNLYEDRYRGLRSILLTEMNMIIERHKTEIDLSLINSSLIKPLPVDLRIVVDWNKDETDIDLHVIQPDGEECFYGHRTSKSGGRMAEDFTQGYGPEEYQIKNATKGRYSIQVNYFGDRYQKKQIPSFIKLTIYKNYGRPDQTVTTENFIMENQTGKVELAEVKW